VTLDRCTDTLDDVGGPGGDAGDGEHALAVGVAAEQPDEADLLVAAGGSHVDRRHPHRAVDHRHGVAAGDHVRRVVLVGGRVDRRGVESAGAVLAEFASLDGHEPVVGAPIAGRAEEHEVTFGEPGEQLVGAGEFEQALLHGREVGDHRLDAVDRRADLVLEFAAQHRLAPIDRHERPRLDRRVGAPDGRDPALLVAVDVQHRVHEEVDAEIVTVEHHADRVDQERDVVGHEHQERAFRLPAVALEVRGEHLDHRVARVADPAQVQMRDDSGVGVVEPIEADVLGRHLPVVPTDEVVEQGVGRSPFTGERFELGDDVGHGGVHGTPAAFGLSMLATLTVAV
jgi:hypothetical protein